MQTRKMNFLHLVIIIIFLIVGVMVYRALVASKPKLNRVKTKASYPIAQVITVKIGDRQINIRGQGNVKPVKEIQLISQVGGKIIRTAPFFVNGGAFKKGQQILQIDPADYEIAITLAKAKVIDAESKFQLALEESRIARKEWELLHPDTLPPPLVAKKPQLAAVQANLEAFQANFEKARLQLNRTRLIAPFDGRINSKKVDFGQYITPGQSLATLFSISAAEVELPLAINDLYWFNVPGFTPGGQTGNKALVQVKVAGRQISWPGQVVRSLGKIDEKTRMIKVVVRIENPYGKKPPLAPGLFVEVIIMGHTLKNVVQIPRSALHPDQVVWVVDKNQRLEFRKVKIARLSNDNVIIQSGLNNGEQVVVSPIKTVSNNMLVRSVAVKGENK